MDGVEKEDWEHKIGKKTFLYIPAPTPRLHFITTAK